MGMLRRQDFLWSIFCLVLFFPALQAIADDSQSRQEQVANTKKRLKDIPVGPFHLDFGANIRLRAEYQSGFDVRRYEPDTTDRFLLTRLMLDLNLRFDSDRRLFVQLRDAHAGQRIAGAEKSCTAGQYQQLVRIMAFERRQALRNGFGIAKAFLDGIHQALNITEHEAAVAKLLLHFTNLFRSSGIACLGAFIAADYDNLQIAAFPQMTLDFHSILFHSNNRHMLSRIIYG